MEGLIRLIKRCLLVKKLVHPPFLVNFLFYFILTHKFNRLKLFGFHDAKLKVKKINGENVKKALVPWYAMGCLTIAWHFNAFSERH